MNEFDELGLRPELGMAFAKLGFAKPTKAQANAIPKILGKEDIFLQSETGTGKTFAYLAPAISRALTQSRGKGPAILVLCPTQELTVQVAKQAERIMEAAALDLGVVSLIGGSPLSRQEAALKKKPAVVVGTPGRLADLLRMRAFRVDALEYLVLDEADRLFSPEYRSAVEDIARACPPTTCKILASATIGASTRRAAGLFMKNPVSLDLLAEGVLSGDIEHWVFYVEHRKKLDFVRRLESALHPEKCLVFASSGDRVERTAERLSALGLPVDAIQARQDKEYRRVALERFAQGSIRYLVTTDLGARGLDIAGITHILNLDFPAEPSGYIHRAGRTGRAGQKGYSIVLADAFELRQAAKLAVGRDFVFRTKVLSEGAVYEPPVEDFFAEVEAGEAEKAEYRAGRRGR